MREKAKRVVKSERRAKRPTNQGAGKAKRREKGREKGTKGGKGEKASRQECSECLPRLDPTQACHGTDLEKVLLKPERWPPFLEKGREKREKRSRKEVAKGEKRSRKGAKRPSESEKRKGAGTSLVPDPSSLGSPNSGCHRA